MKKVLLLLVGIIAIGLYANNQVQAQDEEKITEVVNAEENDGEASAELPLEAKQRSLAKSAETRTIDFRKFHIEVTDGAADSLSVPISNSKFTVGYVQNNREVTIHEGLTNEKGQILNLPQKDIPFEITALRIRFTLGNDTRGYVQRYHKNPYKFVFTLGFNAASTMNIINFTNTKTKFGNTADEESWFYNYQATRINRYFDQAVQKYSNAVKAANELLPDTKSFETAPISINFEKGQFVDKGNGFNRNGHDGSKVADIVIGDRSSKKFSTQYLMHNVMHEWTHWNLYRYASAPGGAYESHYSYNLNSKISFKEGWPLLIGDLFALNYDMTKEDLRIQTDNYNGVNRLFGKSTNYTVKQVLYDLIDTGSNDEDFSISQRYLDGEVSDLDVRKLNLGILHTVMAESKTVALHDLLTAIEKKYVLTKSDKEKFAKVLEVNGLSREGDFTLDNDGNPLTTPLQVSQTVFSEEPVDDVNLDE